MCKAVFHFAYLKQGGARLSREELSRIEKKTYEFIQNVGEVQPRELPDKRMVGAITNLKNRGLVETYSRYTSRFRKRKKKFVRIKKDATEKAD
jgi:hypothetical protein